MTPMLKKQGITPTACRAVLALGLGVVPMAPSVAVGEWARFSDGPEHCVSETSSFVLSSVDRILDSLKTLTKDLGQKNWNGYESEPVNEVSRQNAFCFVTVLPTIFEGADVVVDADGEISIEWYRSKDNYFEVSFASSGGVHCYAQWSGKKYSGIFPRYDDPDLRQQLLSFLRT